MTHTQQLMTQTKQLITISFPVRLKSTQQVRGIRLIYSFNQNTSILIRINLEELLVKQTIWPPDLKRLFKAFQKEADRNKQKEASSRVEIADQDVCRRRKFERKQGQRCRQHKPAVDLTGKQLLPAQTRHRQKSLVAPINISLDTNTLHYTAP